MKSTKKKAVESPRTHEIFAQGKIWTPEQLASYRKYQTEFIKDSYRSFILRCLRIDEMPMIEFLESQDNFSAYIKELITEDMKKKGLNARLSEDEKAKVKYQMSLESEKKK